jgi:hypothetical protein
MTQEGSAQADRSTVLAAFDDFRPLRTGEVADAVDADPAPVETTLLALAEADELGHRTLGVEGVTVDLWYRVATSSDIGDLSSPAEGPGARGEIGTDPGPGPLDSVAGEDVPDGSTPDPGAPAGVADDD